MLPADDVPHGAERWCNASHRAQRPLRSEDRRRSGRREGGEALLCFYQFIAGAERTCLGICLRNVLSSPPSMSFFIRSGGDLQKSPLLFGETRWQYLLKTAAAFQAGGSTTRRRHESTRAPRGGSPQPVVGPRPEAHQQRTDGESWQSQEATLIEITSLRRAAMRMELRHYVVQTGQPERNDSICIDLQDWPS